MVAQNMYTAYKRDTKYLLYWMVNASNTIIKKLPQSDDAALSVNSTGQVTVSEIVEMSKLIAAHLPSIPAVIYHLLKSVINARAKVHQVFEKMASQNPDPELERNNASHKHFIQALSDAFQALGGGAWEAAHGPGEEATTQDNLDELVMFNKFSALRLDGQNNEKDSDDEDASDSEAGLPSAPSRRRATRPGKGKKNKGKKKPKKQAPRQTGKESQEKQVPLESYRIVEDFENGSENGVGLVTDYLLAVYDLFQQMASRRAEIQSEWQEVAYEELNSAVAGALSNVAVKAIQNLDGQIFVDFPGNDSYKSVFDTITRGNPDKLRQNFSIALWGGRSGEEATKVAETYIDIEEQFLFHAYRDLRDFILDFQMNRTGKPTKRMAAELKDWKPDFDLRRATEQERIQWRRAYTINWLYDLVNLFSSIVIQRNTMKGENHDLSRVDWSVKGPWNCHRRLYGLNEFAGFVTSLAMQKPGFDTASKILPHHVFQLQCIVDSMTVSRGWLISGFRGHVITSPSKDFFPRRDVDLFLDRHMKQEIGFLQGQSIVRQLLEKQGIERGNPERFIVEILLLDNLKDDFCDWLGESKYMYGLNSIPPSRFTSSNSNGLWEYSPFLCGTGLLEGLELAYLAGAHLLETFPQPTFILHLHNMLVQRGFLPRQIGLWGTWEHIFRNEFFGPQGPPTSNFVDAFLSCSQRHIGGQQRRQARLRGLKTTIDFPEFLANTKANSLFCQKPTSRLLREANWDIDGIPDGELPPRSLLAVRALARTKVVLDPKTKETKLEETELVRRSKELGLDDKSLHDYISAFSAIRAPTDTARFEKMFSQVAEYNNRAGKISNMPPPATNAFSSSQSPVDPSILLKQDMIKEVSGEYSVLGFSYMWILTQCLMICDLMKRQLKEAGNVSYQTVFGPGSQVPPDQRLSTLFTMALQGDDTDCLKIVADVFWETRTGAEQSLYWKKLDLMHERMMKRTERVDETPDCVIM